MTPNKEKLLAALLTSRTKKEAAAAAGISDRTMRSYFEDKEFCEAYRSAFQELTENATRQAQRLLSPALDTLEEVMKDADAQPAARTNAARIAIESAMKLAEQADILKQLRELEEWREELNANR